ncbi:uroporphyrinogen-III synthase [Microvirga lotononidis]|uniref:Uroporphyrinogen-III synthase n=1 Tax=Microvirga lotononidis TaxID=864069 RepID=I4YS49_9HYPH|nr:uroporphyrinogen-III synthase [Microvirga lotononidis]EIM26791.1 uroporphyrinogen-III synthase [Microvirga lotononidis]WQO31696.1 uroporphyrinogen-III synthase [Microvirga lotononidis]
MRILLTRPQAQSQELGTVLEGHGIEWLGEPLLRIVPVPWDPGTLAGKQALLLTSPNASRELLRVPGGRRDLPIHVVGPGTAAPLLAAGFTDVQAAGGTAVDLIAHVRRRVDPRAGRLLHLSGHDITRDLAVALAPAGFVVDRVVAYRAAAVERLSAEVMRAISRNRIDAAVFLSARTAAIFRDLVITSGIADACARMTAIAISRKVATELRPAVFSRVVAAGTPCLDGVVDAVLRVASKGVPGPQGG